MNRAVSFARDMSALGVQAPLRAGYEIAKRSGVHGGILRAVQANNHSPSLFRLPAFIPDHMPDSEVVTRCLDDAKAILRDGHRVFGHRIPISRADDWHTIGPASGTWPADRWWWQIDIRTAARAGDVKWVWELGRHRDLVVLARAAFLEPEKDWSKHLNQRLNWWFSTNSPEHGVHWYSNLEISLRVLAWIQIYSLAEPLLDNDVVRMFAEHISAARRHLMLDFPYTISSMRNNHLLGDALGILAIDAFTGQRGSWLGVLAERTFKQQLRRHMRSDGSMIEDSLSYHRFVLEMLFFKQLLGDDSEATKMALSGGAEHLSRLGALAGELPQWGDWDEGRVLCSSGDALDIAGSVAAALAIVDKSSDPQWWRCFDEVAWYVPIKRLSVNPNPAIERQPDRLSALARYRVSGGIQHVERGPWSVWFKSGTAPSHQHADLTHVSVRHGDGWVIIDPGTGTYNGPEIVRKTFRTSDSHNGLRVNDEQMFVPHRSFRWLTTADVWPGTPYESSTSTVLWACHDAYVRDYACRVARAVLVHDDVVICADWRERDLPAALTVAVHPDAKSKETVLFGLNDATWVEGQHNPFRGWRSTTYGSWEPTPWAVSSVVEGGVTIWGLKANASVTDPVVEGDRVVHGHLQLSLELAGSPVLTVREGSEVVHLQLQDLS